MAIRKRFVFLLVSLYIFLAQLFFVVYLSNEVSETTSESKDQKELGSALAINIVRRDRANGIRAVPVARDRSLNGMTLPRNHCVYQYEDDCTSMRVVEQLHYAPTVVKPEKKKRILLYGGFGGWEQGLDDAGYFEKKQCRIQNCQLLGDMASPKDADAVIFRNGLANSAVIARSAKQTWIMYLLESPHNSRIDDMAAFNWTATYRLDSTLVTPYSWWKPVDNPTTTGANRNYATGKTKFAAWFVSHCSTPNRRLEFAHELQKHVPIDIYGACGSMHCSRSNAECWRMLDTDYKFYLAFENSNCRHYITEKFSENALGHDVLPVVMGAPRSDYERFAPPKSFVHVEDFPSVRELADYLIKLNQTDQLYNEYFAWKGKYVSSDTKFWCRVCALLNDENSKPHVVSDFNRWWNGPGVCIGDRRWRDEHKQG